MFKNMPSENCQICNTAPFKYTCPRCNIIYCSLTCYKSQEHIKCSEEFYKQCVQEDIRSAADSAATCKDDMRKIYEILKRIRETDAGVESESFDLDGLDSDDDQDETGFEVEKECLQDIEEENYEEDIAERLKDIDVNDADEVWQRLTSTEREEFQKLVSSGDIMKLLPDFKPWWSKKENSKIIAVKSNGSHQNTHVPKIENNISKYSSLCSKEPSPSLHYNLWNIVGAYSCTVRYFNGEHLLTPNEATAYLVDLSQCLKYGTNFEDVEDAILSVEMEALTRSNVAIQLIQKSEASNPLLIESTELKNDCRHIMATIENKLSALSDILRLLQVTKNAIKSTNDNKTEFQKKFALSSGMEELTYSKIKKLIRKIEFLLSYVNRENELKLN